MATKKIPPSFQREVVVATVSRPWLVVAGTLVSEQDGQVELADARCVVYWSADTRSLFGLATKGPQSASRISGACKRVVLRNVEIILDATPAAMAAWREEPWT